MKKLWILLLLFTPMVWSQDDDEDLKTKDGVKVEIGVDGYFSAGTNGGNLGAGLKLGIRANSDSQVIGGPSFRIFRTWSNGYLTTAPSSFNVLGVGAWCHVRFQNVLYLGGEFEVLKVPPGYFYTTPGASQVWIPTLFLGGGYSKSFGEKFRVNLGIFYDVINNLNNPYRAAYLTKKKVGPNGQLGALIPILYRIELFINLN